MWYFFYFNIIEFSFVEYIMPTQFLFCGSMLFRIIIILVKLPKEDAKIIHYISNNIFHRST